VATAGRRRPAGLAARSPDGEGVGAWAGLGQLELAKRKPRLTGSPHRDHPAPGGRPGQHDQAAVAGPGHVGRLGDDVSGAATGRSLPHPERPGRGTQRRCRGRLGGRRRCGCRLGAGLARQAASWRRCGGWSGSAEHAARRWSAPARRWRRAGRRPEPEPDAVAPVIDQAGRPVSRILGGPAGDQQPGWELPELGRA
jgi:hypothetical protein